MNISDFSGIGPSASKSDPREAQMRGRAEDLRNASGLTAKEDEKLREACQEFESFFLYLMMKEMRKTVPEQKLIHGGRAEEIFRDMMDEELAKEMSKSPSAGFGLGQMLYEQLTRPAVRR